jgi:hypothetical protein
MMASHAGRPGQCHLIASALRRRGAAISGGSGQSAPDATTNGRHPTLAERPRRGALPLPAPRPLNPALLQDAEQRAANAEKIAAAMIASAQTSPAPLRLPLGRDTYDDVRAFYVRRLEELDAHRDLALSVLRDERT